MLAIQSSARKQEFVGTVAASPFAKHSSDLLLQIFPPSSFHFFRYSFPSSALPVSVCAKLSRLRSILVVRKGVNWMKIYQHRHPEMVEKHPVEVLTEKSVRSGQT